MISRTAPTRTHVIRSIARRELGIALRGKLVRLLFLFSAVPPLVFGVILVARLMAQKAVGVDLGWDPVTIFLRVQVMPVTLLALGLGTPLVARDRAEDVLYLYAVRPVTPWTYTLGKMFAVALPTLFLLLAPAILIAVLRQGLVPQEITTWDSIQLIGKATLASVLIAGAFAGITVGPSAATTKARWALLIALLFFMVPDIGMQIFSQLVLGHGGWALGPGNAAERLIEVLFDDWEWDHAIAGLLVLIGYAVAGAWVIMARVRQEMIP